MTPLEIEIAFHYVTRGGDYREGDFSAPAVRQAIDRFRSSEVGLLVASDCGRNGAAYVATERCKVYIAKLCDTPLPTQAWIYPTERGAT